MARVFEGFTASGIEGVPPVMAGACALGREDDISAAIDRAKLASESDNRTWVSHLLWYTDQMRERAALRLHVLENVDRAMAEGWIRLYYQGIVRSSTGFVCGEEALARWVDPQFGFCPRPVHPRARGGGAAAQARHVHGGLRAQ